MYYKKLRQASVSVLVWALEIWPIFLKRFATTGQLSRGTPCSPWGRIYDYIQDVWNAMILAGFQETKEGGRVYIHLHPFQSASCQQSFNDNEQRQNVGYRMGTECFVRMTKKTPKLKKLLTLLWAEAAGAGRGLKNKAAAENNSRNREPPLGTFLLDREFLFSQFFSSLWPTEMICYHTAWTQSLEIDKISRVSKIHVCADK